MSNQSILSTIYSNQQLVLKITSGLTEKVTQQSELSTITTNLSAAVSAMLNDYNTAIPELTPSLTSFISDTQNTLTKDIPQILTGFIGSDHNHLAVSTVLDTKLGELRTELDNASTFISGKIGNWTRTETITSAITSLEQKSVSGVDYIYSKISGAIGQDGKVVVSTTDGISASLVTIGSNIFEKYPTSTVLATELGVTDAISSYAPRYMAGSGITFDETEQYPNVKQVSVKINENATELSPIGLTATDAGLSANLRIGKTQGKEQVIMTTTNDAGQLAIYTNIRIEKYVGSDLPSGVASRYQLKGTDGNTLGDAIDIQKDKYLSGAYYDKEHHNLIFVFYTSGGVTSTAVDLSGLVDIYTTSSGLSSVSDREGYATVFGVVDPTTQSYNGNKYLTVDTAGFKVAGINDAINTEVTSARTDLSTYVETTSTTIMTTVASTYVTIAEHEALSSDYQALNTRFTQLWGKISG